MSPVGSGRLDLGPAVQRRRAGQAGARRFLQLFSAVAMLGAASAAGAADQAADALHELRAFATTGRVLHVAAHPDDENTYLIAHLSRGRGIDVAYLSLTRGDGGQNLLGPQLDESLGVARTQELLVARRIDGGRQFFTRAIDFGFSKSPEETLSFWGRSAVLGDIVRVIRQFRPDVIVTRFPIPPGSGGHGHHTASAILAVEAFHAAADAQAYPEQLNQGLRVWQARRIVWNQFAAGAGFEKHPTLQQDIAGVDPVTGETFGSLAGRSRAMHKTQALGDWASRVGSGPRLETFVTLAGEPPERDLLDGVDTTWERVPGGGEIGRLAQEAIAGFDRQKPEASVPALLTLRRKLLSLPTDPMLELKREQLDAALRACLGLVVAAEANRPAVLPGEALDVRVSASQSRGAPVRWVSVQLGADTHPVEDRPLLSPDSAEARTLAFPTRTDAEITRPYWLRQPPRLGLYVVAEPTWIGRPVNPPDLPVTFAFLVEDQVLSVSQEVVWRGDDGPTRPVALVPPVTVSFAPGVALLRPGQTGIVTVAVASTIGPVEGQLGLDASAGWRVSPAQPFVLSGPGERAQLAFTVTAPTVSAVGALTAVARVGDRAWSTDQVTVQYPHITPQLLQPEARKKAVSVEVELTAREIGYVAGAGDEIPEALRQIGARVTTVAADELRAERLQRFDAIVIGVRAFNTRDDLPALVTELGRYVEQGGVVVAQYNWARNLKTDALAPYRLKLSDKRVTDETAEVTFLNPQHRALTSPNSITVADFSGWVQERGIYFPGEWDSRFEPLLAMSDPNEEPLRGGLLVARHGRGYWVYTSLAFFRQLPAGVPGAYRLFANLVSLGK